MPCITRKDAHNVAYLSHLNDFAATRDQKKAAKEQSRNKVLPEGTKLELPLWLGVALQRRSVLSLQKPVYLTEKFFNQVRASADVVTYGNHTNYMYEVVLKLIELYPDEKIDDILAVFIDALRDRFDKIIIDHSQDASQTEARSASIKRLSHLEREIFDLHR